MKTYLKLWGLQWRQGTKEIGLKTHLICEGCKPELFLSRKEACEYADKKYGYIKTRKDLRDFPFEWRMPKPIRVTSIEHES